MWHSVIQSRIIKYRSSKSKCKHFREFNFPNPPEDVVDPCVNRFIEQFCQNNDKIRVMIDIDKAIRELSAFKEYLENITTDESKTRTASLPSEDEMEESDD